jgi:hypothetical protein
MPIVENALDAELPTQKHLGTGDPKTSLYGLETFRDDKSHPDH